MIDDDTVKAMRWFRQLLPEDKRKIVLKAGGRGHDKITAYWRMLQPR